MMPKISFQPVTPTASLSDKDVKVGASAFEVKSDKAGQKKMYLYGNFEWIKTLLKDIQTQCQSGGLIQLSLQLNSK